MYNRIAVYSLSQGECNLQDVTFACFQYLMPRSGPFFVSYNTLMGFCHVIFFCSVTNGGKTTVTNRLVKTLPNCSVVHQDSFFKVSINVDI